MAEQISDKIEETTSDEQIDKMASDEQIDETTLDEQIDKTVSDEQIDETTSDEQIKKILTKARFLFAIQSLHAMMILKMKNVAFSPYSIYEGLLLVYLASSNDTEKQLRCKLHLPDNDNVQNMITNWILHTTERRNTEEELPNYNKINSCWIANNKVVNNIAQNLFKTI
ncbi:serine protease inhibitor 88Ea-like [Nylanderia fulva]|uniref:serine protease inhibitor 88Ea-like n=1 Tax=Nylanderia fulva TaxID=613905 RepID=UPI0010FB0BD1|nr:serine protease inhibitor 88Ea-like [Nylanderia fulva]